MLVWYPTDTARKSEWLLIMIMLIIIIIIIIVVVIVFIVVVLVLTGTCRELGAIPTD